MSIKLKAALVALKDNQYLVKEIKNCLTVIKSTVLYKQDCGTVQYEKYCAIKMHYITQELL